MNCLVIDNGSGFTKCGKGGELVPTSIFPTCVGRPKNPALMIGMNTDCFVGNEAVEKRGINRLKYPVEHGCVTNWNDMEEIWKHSFKDSEISEEDTGVFITEPPLNPKNNREKCISIMFESLDVQNYFVGSHGVLSLFSEGITTGVSVESGDAVTHIIPVYEGYSLVHSVIRLNFGGRDITELMSRRFSERGFEMTTSLELDVLKKLKEEHGHISLDFNEEMKRSENKIIEYELPNGQKLPVKDEIFYPPEIMFNPKSIRSDFGEIGIHEAVFNSVHKNGVDIRKTLYENILISGGNTLFKGFQERLSSELKKKENKYNSMKIKVKSPKDRMYSVWKGASLMSRKISSLRDKWITKDEYDDVGPTIIHRKCFS